ncbi:MAG: hypothetical protein ABFS14_09925 [Gemmatimonadota bacterium]
MDTHKLKIAAVVVLGIAFYAYAYAGDGPSEDPPRRPRAERPEHTDVGAFVACQNFVERNLKAPSTAKFARMGQSQIATRPGYGQYRVVSYVDAQNSFGAMLRNEYTCDVSFVSGDRWRLVDLQMD